MVVTLLPLLSSRPVNAQATPSALTLQFLAYEFPTEPTVSVDLTATLLEDVLKAIAKQAAVTLKYAPTVQPLTAPVSVSVKNETVEAALRRVLDAHALACVVTSSRTVFVYPRTPADEAKYAQTIRDFTIVNAKPMAILMVLNLMDARGELALEPFGQHPAMASDSVRTIRVRATAKVMDQIAKVIAANDK
jgi:hypothetical protein